MKKKKTALCNSNRSRKTRRHFSKKISYGKRAAVLSNSSMYTFKEVLFLWQEHNKLSHKGATEAKYNYLIQKHIIPELGDIVMEDLTIALLNNFIEEKIASGRLDKKGGLSTSYVRTMSIIINSALKFAVDENLCSSLKLIPYSPKQEKKDITVLKQPMLNKLEQYLSENMHLTSLGILLSLYMGLRIGEVCALRWQDIDLDELVLRIRATVTRVKSSETLTKTIEIIGNPKTASAIRDIPIPSNLIPWLKKLKSQEDHFVLSDSSSFISPRTYEYRFHKILAQAEISDTNYHVLRHTFATRCIECGVDIKTLSEFLGHSDVGITLRTYVHPSMELKRTQIEKLAKE